MDETPTPARTRVAATDGRGGRATDRLARRFAAQAGAVAVPGRRRATAVVLHADGSRRSDAGGDDPSRSIACCSAWSPVGCRQPAYVTASTIMGLENVLDQLEGFTATFDRPRGRDPLMYYVRVLRAAVADGTWSWRFGGHHVSLNFTIIDGVLSGATPLFLGADPASAPLLGPHPLAAARRRRGSRPRADAIAVGRSARHRHRHAACTDRPGRRQPVVARPTATNRSRCR